MRIISGTHQRRKIKTPNNLPVRPTTDFAKEALFNILKNKFPNYENMEILDLFAGTGNISYEFASRGAKSVTAIEQDRRCIAFIKKTAEELDFPIHVTQFDVFKYINRAAGSYDIVFADPPYDISDEEMIEIYQAVVDNLLKEGGVLILEHSKHTLKNQNLEYQIDKRKYGSTTFTLIQK